MADKETSGADGGSGAPDKAPPMTAYQKRMLKKADALTTTNSRKAHRKERRNAPKITKEERRAKYTAKARDKRDSKNLRQKEKGLVCFRCREKGHSAASCTAPEVTGEASLSSSVATGERSGGGGDKICYKCGSMEHNIRLCPKIQSYIRPGQKKIDFGKIGELPFANCYICNNSGHLASFCTNNKKGLFPNGGGCRECGSVEHFATNCPQSGKKKKKEQKSDDESVDIEQFLEELTEKKTQVQEPQKKKKKIVKF